jgi:mRNA interferase MazF
MKSKRGDVVLVPFPGSDLVTVKRRPALIVQADNLNSGLPQAIVAMISSNPARAGHPSRVFVSLASPQGTSTGLHSDSWIMTDNLATILEKHVERVLGAWPDMTAVDDALRHTLGL